MSDTLHLRFIQVFLVKKRRMMMLMIIASDNEAADLGFGCVLKTLSFSLLMSSSFIISAFLPAYFNFRLIFKGR